MEIEMMSPFGNVLNTRESYSRFYQEVFTEVEVQFGDERPAWIPYETLLAIKECEVEFQSKVKESYQ